MKNKIIFVMMLFGLFILGGCNEEKEEKYTAFEINQVEIHQKSKTKFTVFVSLDNHDYEDIHFYFTRYDRLKETDQEVEAIKVGQRYQMNIEQNTGDYFLYAKVGENVGFMPITLPKMSPFITIDKSGDKPFAKIDYSIDGKTSWSSFIDPRGKNVYKSEESVFNESAVEVGKNINIIEGSTNDLNYDAKYPYYYVVLMGKGEKVKFVSYPLTSSENVFDTISAKIEKDNQNKPILKVHVKTKYATLSQYELMIRTNGTELKTQGTIIDNMNMQFSFDLERLQLKGVWYDIIIEDTLNGQQTNVTVDHEINSTVSYGERQYFFREYNRDLKICFDNGTDAFELTTVSLSLINGKPILTISGVLKSDIDKNSVALVVRSGSDVKTILESVSNTNDQAGKFTFVFDASKLTMRGTWYDLDISYGSAYYSIHDSLVTNVSSSVSYNGNTYSFRVWQHILKIAY